MAVNLSPIWGAGAQLLDNSGNVLTGGKIYTYLAGTTTPATTYTSSSGGTANSNPIILNSAGRVPYEIWLTDSIIYKFVLKDSNDVLIGTWDNLIGINSNFINYYGQQEIQTATAGQTVFTLTEIDYQPGTGNLSVFVDGVNQYGPGAQYAFVETDSTTVTFASGLHVGASVKFTTTKLENVNVADASQISYTYPDSNAVAQNVEDRLAQYVSVKDFGAVGDGVTDDTTAIQNAIDYGVSSGKTVFFPYGMYLTSTGINITTPIYLNADPETRIKLTASKAYVVQFDYTGGGAFFDHGGGLENFVLDGNGFATDGLVLKAVISANFTNIRVTNVTTAGLALRWAQVCLFTNYACSDNIESFTTTPVNGILADTASSSANTFINPVIEHVSGSGIKGSNLINSVFINGTSEGNDVGIEFSGGGNSVVGMDLEVNATSDIVLFAPSGGNNFYGLSAGYASGEVLIKNGSINNSFFGGITGGFIFESGSNYNRIYGTDILGAGRTISDSGTNNSWDNVVNVSTATFIDNSATGARYEDTVAGGGTASFNARQVDYAVIKATGSTITINPPSNAMDGQAIDLSVWNTSGGTLTVTWAAGIQIAGWVDPATGKNRSVRLRYNASAGAWYAIFVSQNDLSN